MNTSLPLPSGGRFIRTLQQNRKPLALLISLVSLGLTLFPAEKARAADGTWILSNANGSWSNQSNWAGTIIADGEDSTADFSTLNITANRTVTLDSSRTIGNLIFGDATTSSNSWILTGSALTLQTSTGTPSIRVNNQTATISLSLGGNDGLTKSGAGSLVLSAANTYTGTTTITGGAFTLSGAGSLASSTSLNVGGNAVFNFSGAAAATQSVSGTTVSTGFSQFNNTVSGTTLSLNALTRSGSGMVAFTTTTGDIDTTSSNTNGIIGAWAFRGTGTSLDYAVSNGAGTAISSLGSVTALPSTGGDASTNYTLGGAQTQTGNTVGNTLRYTGAANTIALGTTSLGLSGLMNAGTGALTISGTAGNPGLVSTGDLNVMSNGQNITISAVISGTGSLAYGSTTTTGLLTLSGVNTYGGGTFINSGILRAQNSAALSTGDVTVANGAKLQLQGNVSLANDIFINGTQGLESSQNNNVVTGTVTLQSNSTISAANQSSTSLTVTDVDLGTNTLTVSANGGSTGTVTISGTINGTGGITKTGTSPLTISGDQSTTYSGTTTVQNGTLALGHDGALGSGALVLSLPNDAGVTIRSSSAAARTYANDITISGGNANSRAEFGSSTTGSQTFTGAVLLSGTGQKSFRVANTTTFQGVISGSTASSGIRMDSVAGTLILEGANTYTGATTVNVGTLLVNGSLSTGAVTVAAGATLGGSGTIGGATTVNGNLSPGNSPGTLTINNDLTLTATANSTFEINGVTEGSLYDSVLVSGALTYDGVLNINFGYTPVGTVVFDLFDFSSQGGTFSAINVTGAAGTFNYVDGTFIVVPEPSPSLLLIAGVGLYLTTARRRRTR